MEKVLTNIYIAYYETEGPSWLEIHLQYHK